MNTWTSIFANIWFQIKQIWLIFLTHLKLWVVVKMKWWSFTPPLCIYRITGQEKPPENCEMNEMTLPFRHRIRNSNPDGLRLSPLPLGYGSLPNIEFLRVSREETFCFFETWMPEWGSNPRSPTFLTGSFNHYTRVVVARHNFKWVKHLII